MKNALFLPGLVLLSACQGKPVAREVALPEPPPPAAASDDRMTWWREARFGMFLHWGLYSVPAGEWNGRTDHAEWIMTTAQIPVEQYEKFRERFNPTKFDAQAWARMAADAGMKYVVITSKHHDGFALFDSKISDYDVMSTPFQRDILRELAEAVRGQGMQMCWYHSIMDWHHPDYLPRRDWELRSSEGADFARFRAYLAGQVGELLTNYGKIGVMWFDGEWESTWTNDYGKELYALCRKLQPDVIVNNRVSTGRGGMAGMTKGSEYPGDFGTPEQEIPAQGLPGVDWETCMTMNDHWGFNAADDRWKSDEDLIRKLCDIASKGGNFLLNIGPRADGTFPPESVERLAAIGRWMKVNGEAIHGTRASPLESPAWGRSTVRTEGAGAAARTTLYLHVFDWPADGALVLEGLGNHVEAASLLGDPARVIPAMERADGVTLLLGSTAPDPIASVVAVQLLGAPIVYRAPTMLPTQRRFLEKSSAVLEASGVEVRYTLDGSPPEANSPRFEGRIEIGQSCTLKARSFLRGRAVSKASEFEFERVTAWPALATPPSAPGLLRECFSGSFDRLPDLSGMTPTKSDVVAEIGLPAGTREEHVVHAFSGAFRVEQDSVCEFSLTSDDGARLWIDGKLVVDNDGLHGPEARQGDAPLAQGWHAIRVEWFNKTGGAELELGVRIGLGDFEEIRAADLAH